MKYNKLLVVSMAAVLSLSLAGCSSASNSSSSSSNGTVAVKELKGEELNKIEKDDKEKEKYLVIDVREAKDYEKGHVAGAKNIDVKNIDKDLAALLPTDKNAPVYTYCYSGNRSSKAAQKAVELGYTNVYNAWDGTKEHEYKF